LASFNMFAPNLFLVFFWRKIGPMPCLLSQQVCICLVHNDCFYPLHCFFNLSWKLFWKAWKITSKVVGHEIGGITMWSHPNQITTQVLLFLSSHENYAHIKLLYVDYNERCCLELTSWIMIEIPRIKQLSFMPFCILMHDPI